MEIIQESPRNPARGMPHQSVGCIAKMCKKCIVSENPPDRGRTCLDAGAYILNLGACGNCGARGSLPKSVEVSRTVNTDTDDEGESEEVEEVTFQHVCTVCEHVIAEHYYRFTVDSHSQRYLMDCRLCGRGADEIFLNLPPSAAEESKDGVKNGQSDARNCEIVAEVGVSSMAKAMDNMLLRARNSVGADEMDDSDENDWS